MAPPPAPPLLLWQKRQAALIEHYASLEYLKEVQRRFNALLGETDTVVETSLRQGRDRVLEDPRWGHRNTTDNWANSGAWSAMKDTQRWLARCVAMRAVEVYAGSGMYNLARMLQEFSTSWMTLDEEARFEAQFEQVHRFAIPLDKVLEDRRIDYIDYYLWWKRSGHLFPRLPKYRIRTDVEAETGKVPPRTGVYVAQGDPNAGLQFGWTGQTEHSWRDPMPEVQTFNDIGLHALQYVGRDRLWFDVAKMEELAMLPQYRGKLTYKVAASDSLAPEWLNLSNVGIVARPAKFYLVERVHGEWDDETESPDARSAMQSLRAEPGQAVPRAGVWVTPALQGAQGRLQLAEGQRLPETKVSPWGAVFWYWSAENQPR